MNESALISQSQTSTVMELICEICYNPFGDKSLCPRVLLCGHTYCTQCIKRFIQDKSPCPKCSVKIEQKEASRVPVNFLAVSMLETTERGIKESDLGEADIKEGQLPYEGHCLDHSAPNHFMCLKCWKLLCGTCIVINHQGCKTVKIPDALQKVQENKSEDLEVKIQLLQQSNQQRKKYIDKLSVSLKDLKESTNKVEKNLKQETKLKTEGESLLRILKNLKD